MLFDESLECVIVDAGCYTPQEFLELSGFIADNNLEPKALLSTHSHLDHVFGNHVVLKNIDIPLGIHPEDLQTLKMLERTADMYQIPNVFNSPDPDFFLNHGDVYKFGKSELEVRFVPGHAPGHIVFVNHQAQLVINGDCLFAGSIGRTDLPGGNHQTLLDSINAQLFSLPDDYTVYCGHGPETKIGFEKSNNPFF